jgi:hypothetical protein
VARLIRIGARASIRANRANMLPGVSTDVGGAGRQPLNPVSNTPARMGDVAAAMQKLVSEKAARKAKSSAAALIQQEARGAACITPRGALDVKMPPLPPGSVCAECDAAPVRPCRIHWLTRSRGLRLQRRAARKRSLRRRRGPPRIPLRWRRPRASVCTQTSAPTPLACPSARRAKWQVHGVCKFSKVVSIVALHGNCTNTLTFENFCPKGANATSRLFPPMLAAGPRLLGGPYS